MSKLSSNEKRKLTATYFNGIAMALVTVGILAPLSTLLLSSSASYLAIGLLAGTCGVVSGGLHWLARWVLEGLED